MGVADAGEYCMFSAYVNITRGICESAGIMLQQDSPVTPRDITRFMYKSAGIMLQQDSSGNSPRDGRKWPFIPSGPQAACRLVFSRHQAPPGAAAARRRRRSLFAYMLAGA